MMYMHIKCVKCTRMWRYVHTYKEIAFIWPYEHVYEGPYANLSERMQTMGKQLERCIRPNVFSYCHSTKKLRISSKCRFSLGFYSCWVYLFYVFFIIWIAFMQRHHFNSFRTKSLPLPFMTGSHRLWGKKVRPSTACCSLQHLLLGAVRLVSSNISHHLTHGLWLNQRSISPS